MIKRMAYAEQCMVRLMCALALLFVGFAHKPPVDNGNPITLSEITRYTLPDGTVPVLCLPSEDGKARQTIGSGCEACRLTASVLLPAPSDALGQPILRQIERFIPAREETFHRQLLPPNASPRGPPPGLIA